MKVPKKVEIVYGITVAGRVSKKSTGLRVDGQLLDWKQVEDQYGIDSWTFRRRKKRNPNWSPVELLTYPKYIPKNRTLNHTREQLETNRIACSKWR